MDRTYTEWTCDYCFDVVSLDHGMQPERWVGIEMSTPPKGALGRNGRSQMCDNCLVDFEVWKAGQKGKHETCLVSD